MLLGQEQAAASSHPSRAPVVSHGNAGPGCLDPTWTLRSGWGRARECSQRGFVGLKSPPSTQSASRCLASSFSLTSEGARRTWRVRPVPDPGAGLARRGWWERKGSAGRGGGHGLPSPTPAPGGRAQPTDADTAESPLPESSDGAWNVGWDRDIRRIRGASRRWGPHRPPRSASGPLHQLHLPPDASRGSLAGSRLVLPLSLTSEKPP